MTDLLPLLEKALKEVAHGRLPPPDVLKPLISKVGSAGAWECRLDARRCSANSCQLPAERLQGWSSLTQPFGLRL